MKKSEFSSSFRHKKTSDNNLPEVLTEWVKVNKHSICLTP